MHKFMPQSAARAKLKLDEALMDLQSAQRQIDQQREDIASKGIGEIVREAIQHVQAALDLLS